MKMRVTFAALVAIALLAACGQQKPPPAEDLGPLPSEQQDATAPAELPPVDAALLGAPNSTFTPFEPSEAGIIGAADIKEALGPMISAESVGEGETLKLSIQEGAENAVADVVRDNMADDAIQAAHVRVEFRKEPEGWFPTNAYRRAMCRRGAYAGQWSTMPCP